MSDSRAVAWPDASFALGLPSAEVKLVVDVNQPVGAGITIGYTSPSHVAGISTGSTNAPGAIVLFNDSAFVSVSQSSSTAYAGVTKADNYAITTPSYTFVTSADQCTKIFSAQCDRVSNFIFGQLEQVDRSDDDQNEVIVDDIANVIGLVGEPAAYTALLEASLLKSDPTVLEPLLLAIGTARHKETEADRIQVLQHYAGDADYRIKHAAVRALGRVGTETARSVLREISDRNQGVEIGRFAAALLR